MKEGFIATGYAFGNVWPYPQTFRLGELVERGALFVLDALPNGALRYEVRSGGSIAASFISQPLAIDANVFARIVAQWTPAGASLEINGLPVLSQLEANGAELTIPSNGPPLTFTPSTADGGAVAACQTWIDWRTKAYGLPLAEPKAKRRLKTEDEQLAELGSSARSLTDLSELVLQGHINLVGHLATELRALLAWNGKQYHPLLLRLAGRMGLPLPVYYRTERMNSMSPSVLNRGGSWVESGAPSLLQRSHGEELGDLMGWLNRLVLRLQVGSVPHALSGETLTAEGVITAAASTLGSAHYDEDVSAALDKMLLLPDGPTNMLTAFLLNTADVVVELASYVLKEATLRTAGPVAPTTAGQLEDQTRSHQSPFAQRALRIRVNGSA